jgi:hypothetical protein
MAARCEHCKHWTNGEPKGKSRSGYVCYEGTCSSPFRLKSADEVRHSLMHACVHFSGRHDYRKQEPR